MAGDIWITDDARWVVNNSLFNFVIEFLINHIGDPDTVAELKVIDDNNLKFIDASDFPAPARASIIAALRDDLVPEAEKRLPGDDWAGFRDELRELAQLAATDSPSDAAAQ